MRNLTSRGRVQTLEVRMPRKFEVKQDACARNTNSHSRRKLEPFSSSIAWRMQLPWIKNPRLEKISGCSHEENRDHASLTTTGNSQTSGCFQG